jgi:hypothetical protein
VESLVSSAPAASEITPSRKPRDRRLLVLLGLAALAVIAAVPRVLVARHTPLDADEIYLVLLARKGLAGMLRIVAEDVEQPLFYIMTWAWRALGGESDLWIRTLSIIAGVAGVLVIVPLGKRLFSAPVGWLAAALLALQRTHIMDTQTAKPTATLWLLLSLALLGGWAWLRERKPWQAVLFVGAGTAAMYTYYFSLFPLAVLGVSGAILLRRERRALFTWLGLVAAIALLFGPLVPTWWAQTLRDVQGDAKQPPMGVDQLMILGRRLTSTRPAAAAAIVALMLTALADKAHRRAAIVLWAMLLVPILLPFALSHAGAHLFFYGQMEFALPIAFVLVAAGVLALPSRLPRGAAGVLIVALVAWEGARTVRPVPDPFAAAVKQLGPLVHDGDVVVATEPHALLYAEYHLAHRLRYRLLVMPGVEPFHYSDAVLAVPDSMQYTPSHFETEERKTGERWWGLRFLHFPLYRTGATAATLLDSLARGPIWHENHVTIWSGEPLPVHRHRSPPAS